MIRNIYMRNKKGFTLIELSIVLAALAILTTAVVPFFINQAYIKAGEKTSLEMGIIQEAARAYYIDNNAWPTDISVLQTEPGEYLNPSWVTNNPWGNAYSVGSTAATFTVSTDVLTQWTNLVARDLPSTTISDTTVNSTIPIPGATGAEGALPGIIVMWSGTLASIPEGWALCDGNNGTPDLRDKFIYGVHSGEDPGATGGSATHDHVYTCVPRHNHTGSISPNPHTHGLTTTWCACGAPNYPSIGGWGECCGRAPIISSTSLSVTINNKGSASCTTQPESTLPSFYKLAFIMKL